MNHLLNAALAIVAVGIAMPGATISQTYLGALPFTTSGSLPDQASVLEQTFTLASPTTVLIRTNSYQHGGFQTNLQLYDSMGMFIMASMPGGMPDAMTGLIGDSVLITPGALAAGTYTVALTDWLLTQPLGATSLSDGFSLDLGDGTDFIDANGNTRSDAYSLTIQAVPEPATVWLSMPVLLWIGARATTRRKRVH